MSRMRKRNRKWRKKVERLDSKELVRRERLIRRKRRLKDYLGA